MFFRRSSEHTDSSSGEESESLEATSILDDDELQESRTNFAIFHFALTAPKYSISLFLFLAARCIPLSTPYEAIHLPLAQLHRLVQVESNSYLTCTKNAFGRVIHSELDILAEEEYDRVQEAQQDNKELIERGQVLSQECSKATSKARKSIQTWRAVNGMESTTNATCKDNDRLFLISFLAEDSAVLIKEGISSVVQDYVESSTRSLERFHGYAQERLQYDYHYFVTNRIHPTLQLLQDSKNYISGEPFTFLIDKRDVQTRLAVSLQDVAILLEKAEARIDDLGVRMKDYADSIDHFYSSYDDVYRRIMDGADFVLEFLPVGSELPELFDLATVPTSMSLLPELYYYPTDEFFVPVQEILDKTTERCLRVLEEVYAQVEHQATHQFRGSATGFSNRMSSLLSLDDYNPPSFQGSREGIESLTEEVDHLESLGLKAEDSAKAALDYLQPLFERSSFRDGIQVAPTIKDWNQSALSFTEDSPTTTFEYLQPLFPSFSIPELLKSLVSWILSNAWIVEVSVQALRLWALEAKYSKGAIPDLPIIHYEDEDVKDESNNEEPTLLILLLKTVLSALASPGFLAVLILIPLCFGVMIMWRPHLKSNCQDTMQGTYLANHFLAPLFINEANAAGNALYLQGEMECHQTQRSICNEMQMQLGATYQSDIATLHAIRIQRNESVEAIRVMESCLDLDLNAQQMEEACSGLKGFGTSDYQGTNLTCPMDETRLSSEPASSFRPLNEYLDEAACHDESFPWELNDARFNCTPLIHPCNDIPCTGVNEDYLLFRTVQTDCKIELYILDTCAFLLMVAYQIFAVNLVCTMLFQGSRQIFWRKLCPNGVRLHTQLHENGDLVLGREKADRSERVLVAIQHFQLVGKLKVTIGIAAFVCWAISLVIFRHLDFV
jgi:hypothetical protein